MTYFYIGECFEKLNSFTKALQNYRKSLELDPLLADAWVSIAMIYVDQGKQKVAINHIHKAIDIEPMNSEYWYMLADVLVETSDLQAAIEAYEKSADLDPLNPDIWLDFSHGYILLDDIEAAIEILNKGMHEQIGNASLLYRKFVYLVRSKKFKQAYEILEEALMMDYEPHLEIFEYDQELENDANLLRIIELYKSQDF